jgi:hypothetical protein
MEEEQNNLNRNCILNDGDHRQAATLHEIEVKPCLLSRFMLTYNIHHKVNKLY